MRTGPILAVALLASACAPQPPLTQQSAGLACLPLSGIVGRRVVGPDTLLFETAGGPAYQNVLIGHCAATERLGSSASIGFPNARGDQICEGDAVRIFDVGEAGATDCRLGRFQIAG